MTNIEEIRQKIEEIQKLSKLRLDKQAELQHLVAQTPELAVIGEVMDEANICNLNTDWISVRVTDAETEGWHICEIRQVSSDCDHGTLEELTVGPEADMDLMDDLLDCMYDIPCKQIDKPKHKTEE
jgi:hypothetical protein